jgi:hypothetical protein
MALDNSGVASDENGIKIRLLGSAVVVSLGSEFSGSHGGASRSRFRTARGSHGV